jgi:formate dehydrogenase iron-sulfur subunit
MKLERRDFLKLAGVAAARVAAGSLPSDSLAGTEHFTGNPDRRGILVDTTQCIGLNCRRCEFACAKENGLPLPEKAPEDASVFEETRRTHENQFTFVNRFDGPTEDSNIYVKRQCMHCDEPACASACLVQAFHQNRIRGRDLRSQRLHRLPLLYGRLPLRRPRVRIPQCTSSPREEVHFLF